MFLLFEIVIKDVCLIKFVFVVFINEVEEVIFDYLNIIMFGFWL